MDLSPLASNFKPKIVLVDDYEANLLALEIPLRDLNCEIFKFSSGKAALDFIEKNEIAVILLDIKMPIMDGYEVAQRVRLMPHAKSTPIIFITGMLPNEELIEKAYQSGGSDYIVKPINLKVLTSKVSIFIELFISRNQLALKALVASEEKFRSLSESMPQMVFTSDPDGITTHFNQRWYDYTGFEAAYLDPKFWVEIIHPDDLSELFKTWEQAKSSGQAWTHEYRVKRHDGVYRWHLGRSIPDRNNESQIIQWIGTVTDIEDQKLLTQDEEFRANLTAQINSMEKLDELVKFVTSSLGEYLKVTRCFITEVSGSSVRINGDYAMKLQSLTGTHNFNDFGQEIFSSMKAGVLLTCTNVLTDLRTQANSKAYEFIGMHSFVSVPLIRGDELVGTLNIADSIARNWTDREVDLVRVVADTVWATVERTKLLSALKLSTNRSGFLSRASGIFNSSLDVEKVLTALADLAVPELADWCAIRMVDNEGELKQVAVSHQNPEKVKWAWELQKHFPPDKDTPTGAFKVLRTGQPDFVADVTDEMLRAAAKNESNRPAPTYALDAS